MADNRNYHYESGEIYSRPEYAYFEHWVTNGAKVIDLGCGNGSLLRILKDKKNITESGIEISESGVEICRKNGLNVRQGRIDVELPHIKDDCFDFAVCNVTLQMVMNPEVLLKEMKRVSKRQIISFPNFAFLLQRLDLLFRGRMPRKLLYGYDWYSTGHIHQLSIKDFRKTATEIGLKTVDAVYLAGRHRLQVLFMPNLFATAAIFLLEK